MGIEIPASISNVTQVDRLQSDSHNSPIVNQEQNAQLAHNQQMQRLNMPVQPDTLQNKITDPKDKKTEKEKNKKRKPISPNNQPRPERRSDGGMFIDVDA